MKLDFDFKFKQKLFGNRRGTQTSDARISTEVFQDAYIDHAVYFGEAGYANLQPQSLTPRQAFARWTCFPRRRRSAQPVLLDAPTYEEALELDSHNPTRVVRKRVLRSFPKGKPKGQVAKDGCRICLSDFPRKTAELPCKHIFCKECINKWLGSQRTCPVCRYEFSDAQTKLIIPK